MRAASLLVGRVGCRRLSTSSSSNRLISVSALCASRRCNATTTTAANTSAAATSEPSPVNVEEFTLNEEVVQRHLAIGHRWSELNDSLQANREKRDFAAVLDVVNQGMTLLAEVGPMNAPVQCETNLHLEAAQALFNLTDGNAALERAKLAKASLGDFDAAKSAEIDEFIGHIHLLRDQPTEAEQTFRAVLKWIDIDAKKAMPMVAVAAVNQRRTVLMGVGLSLKAQADKEVATKGDGRALYAQALDILIDSLNLNIEANDQNAVKDILRGVVRCFVGVGDAKQAETTCEKYISWCTRHEDADGVATGNAMLEEIRGGNAAAAGASASN